MMSYERFHYIMKIWAESKNYGIEVTDIHIGELYEKLVHAEKADGK